MGSDLADLQQLEDREAFFSRVLRSAVNGVYVFDLSLQRNVFVSPRYTELTGYSLEEINRKKDGEFLALFHPDDLEGVLAHMGRVAAASDGERVPLEYRFRHKDGHWVWLFGHDVPYERAADGSLVRFMGSFVDITPQKQLQADLEHFAHAAAHDLREPAQRIALSADLVGELWGGTMPADARQLFDSVQAESGRLIELLTAFRAMSGLNGPQHVERDAVELDALARQVTDQLVRRIDEQQAEIEFDQLGLVQGNAALLSSVYANLLNNALTYGGARTRVRCTREGSVYGVWNSGSTIPAEHLEAIFRPFRRFQPGATGSGLGLSICARVIALHDGRIWAEAGPEWVHIRFELGGD